MKRILSLAFLVVLCVFLCSCQKETIVICGNCALEVPKSSKYCPGCGVALFQNNANPSATNNTTEQPDTPQNTTNNTTTHTHVFSSATCTEPAKCSCGETNGDALGHMWKDATCTSAKKCSRCGQTDGPALEHTWNEATCTLAKKCSQCGQTEGAALGHTATSVCTRCNTRLGWTKEEVQSLIKVYAVRVSDIDSADGVDMQIAWENTSSKSIKYVYFTVEAYNAVDDKVHCEIRDYSEFTGKATGPFESGYSTLIYDAGDDAYSIDMYWENCYYNSTVRYFVLTNIHIIYMDNSEVNIDSDYTDCAFADIPQGLMYTWNEAYNGYEVNYRLKKNCAETSITIPKTYNGKNVVAISDRAFYGISAVQEIVLPDTIKYIGCGAFSGCGGLKSISIPDGVTSIENSTFYGCSGLTSITIPDGVTSIGSSAFSSCTGLISLTLPNSIANIGYCAFSSCLRLTSITISEGVVQIDDRAFENCVAIKEIHFNAIALKDFAEDNRVFSCVGQGGDGISVTIGAKVTKIPAYLFCPERYFGDNAEPKIVRVEFAKGSVCTSIGNEAFNGCRSLSYIALPKSITSIGNEAFARCALTSITLPEGITNIGDSMFSFCDNLTSIVIPDGVTSIGNFVFYGCEALTSITIPQSVVQIGEHVFMSCPSLSSIIFKGTVKQWNAIDKEWLWDYDITVKEVICSDGTVRIGW